MMMYCVMNFQVFCHVCSLLSCCLSLRPIHPVRQQPRLRMIRVIGYITLYGFVPVANPGFPRGKSANRRGGGPTYYFPVFPSLDPPLCSHDSTVTMTSSQNRLQGYQWQCSHEGLRTHPCEAFRRWQIYSPLVVAVVAALLAPVVAAVVAVRPVSPLSAGRRGLWRWFRIVASELWLLFCSF